MKSILSKINADKEELRRRYSWKLMTESTTVSHLSVAE